MDLKVASSRSATPEDLERIARFNRTEWSFPNDATLQELIETQVEKHSADAAVICDHDHVFGVSSLTYGQLNDKVNQLAHLLRAEGVGPGQIVAIMAERSFAMIIGILGIIKAGAAYLPISSDHPSNRIDYMLRDGSVTTLLVQEKTAGRVSFRGRTLNLDDLRTYEGTACNPPLLNKPGDVAYVIYTSGSTGKPKGVMIEHRSLVNRLHWMQQRYPIDDRDVVLQKTPYDFDVSVWELFWPLLSGGKLCFLMPRGEKHPLPILQTIRKNQVTVMHFVPSMLNVFLEYLDGKDASVFLNLASVRRVFASGEALTPSHVRKFNDILYHRTGARLTNLYGPTEATVDVSYFDCPTHNAFDIIPIGKPIQNTRFYVIKDGQQVAIGEVGELCVAGIGLARGYLNAPALTAEKFTEDQVSLGERVYRTGDIARWLPDGQIQYLGREDQQVKIRGLRIELGEIETTIREYANVTDCVVVVRTYSENIIQIVAYIVCKPAFQLDDLRDHLKRHLPDYMIPHHFQRVSEIPLTPSGKADRKILPDRCFGGRPYSGLSKD